MTFVVRTPLVGVRVSSCSDGSYCGEIMRFENPMFKQPGYISADGHKAHPNNNMFRCCWVILINEFSFC